MLDHTNILLDEHHKPLYMLVADVECDTTLYDTKHMTFIGILTLCEDKGLIPILKLRFHKSGREDLFTPNSTLTDNTKSGWIEEFNLVFDNFIKDLKTQFGKDKVKIVKKTALTFKEDEDELKIVEKLKESKIFDVLDVNRVSQKIYKA